MSAPGVVTKKRRLMGRALSQRVIAVRQCDRERDGQTCNGQTIRQPTTTASTHPRANVEPFSTCSRQGCLAKRFCSCSIQRAGNTLLCVTTEYKAVVAIPRTGRPTTERRCHDDEAVLVSMIQIHYPGLTVHHRTPGSFVLQEWASWERIWRSGPDVSTTAVP